jgi:hypothetical protein
MGEHDSLDHVGEVGIPAVCLRMVTPSHREKALRLHAEGGVKLFGYLYEDPSGRGDIQPLEYFERHGRNIFDRCIEVRES